MNARFTQDRLPVPPPHLVDDNARRQPDAGATEEHELGLAASDVAWAVFGAASVVLLLVALISPAGLRAVLVALGFLVLMVVRFSVRAGSRVPRVSVPARSGVEADARDGSEARAPGGSRGEP